MQLGLAHWEGKLLSQRLWRHVHLGMWHLACGMWGGWAARFVQGEVTGDWRKMHDEELLPVYMACHFHYNTVWELTFKSRWRPDVTRFEISWVVPTNRDETTMKASRLHESVVIGHIAVGSLELCLSVSEVLLHSCCVGWDSTCIFRGFIPSTLERIQKHTPPPSPQWPKASSFTRFLDHTQRLTTVGRTPVDECSVRRRDLYLTTQHSQQTNRRTPMRDSNRQCQQTSGRRPTP